MFHYLMFVLESGDSGSVFTRQYIVSGVPRPICSPHVALPEYSN